MHETEFLVARGLQTGQTTHHGYRHHSDTQGIRCMSDARDSTSQASGSHRVDDGGERIALKRSTTNKEAINVGLLSSVCGGSFWR